MVFIFFLFFGLNFKKRISGGSLRAIQNKQIKTVFNPSEIDDAGQHALLIIGYL